MLGPMGEVDQLVGAARVLVRELLADARKRLMAGADMKRIHGYYLLALRLLEEAETRGILAAGGEQDALGAIERTLESLQALQDELRREFPEEEIDC